jgi:tetratricopeptide (TPR) repeat protein
MPIVIALLLFLQAAQPPLIDRLKDLSTPAAVRAVKADPAATRHALDDLLVRVDASVHSDRERPEQRRVQYDSESLALGARIGSVYASATGDRSYARKFKARQQRLSGTELLNQRRYRQALGPLSTALREAQALDDAWLEVITRINIGYAQLELGHGREALAACQQAAERANSLDVKARALALFNLGSIHLHRGNAAESIVYSQQAVTASREAKVRLWEGNALMNIGAAQLQSGDIDASRQSFEQALEVLLKTSDRLGQGRVLYNLGLVAMQQQRVEDAASYMERALPIIRAVDIRHSHEIETGPGYQNPIEVSALQVLVEAYTTLGLSEKEAVHAAALERLKARQKPTRHTHGPPK